MKGAVAVHDIKHNTKSLPNFKRNTPEFLRQLTKIGRPVVLTINGRQR
jgi:hypothetical protein